ncbi:MAG: radical SAM protein, partial [Acidobacteriota bacterium]
MANHKVALIEFSVFQGVFPLASGYLEATASNDPRLEGELEFEKYSFCVSSPGIAEKIDQIEADVYGFSCYVWNTGLVKRLLPRLLAQRPRAQVILGGPQVMNKADLYLAPEHESLVLCNGEGEVTFTDYLVELASNEPDLRNVNGLSFYRGGELVTTPKQERLMDLNQIPSPYLGGYLESRGEYVWAVIETNRGCPFKCTYCYWGAATNAKVHKYDLDRILEELTWLSENAVVYVFFADANFGMLKRDLEIAHHLADLKKKNGHPITVYFSSSKNTPDRVTEITKVFDEAGMVATQPISLQTVSMDTLENVKRSNIKKSSYTDLQRVLNERGLSSFLEMIWPLPGETLSSFKQGIGELCGLGADSFMIYPLLLINNVEMDQQRDEYGLVTIDDPDPNSEAEIVIETKDVSHTEYLEGLRFSYHVTSLYTARGLRHLGRYLDSTGRMGFSELLSAFSDFCHQASDNPYSEHIEETLAASGQYKFSSVGGIAHIALHTGGKEFDDLLSSFVRS